MPRLLILVILATLIALAGTRYTLFSTAPALSPSPAVTPFPGIGYLPVSAGHDVTYLYANLSQPVSVSLDPDLDRLLVTQATGETLAFSRDPEGAFSQAPRLHYQPVPTPAPGPDITTLVIRHPAAIAGSFPTQPTNTVTDPRTGFTYFADYSEGRLYRIRNK